MPKGAEENALRQVKVSVLALGKKTLLSALSFVLVVALFGCASTSSDPAGDSGNQVPNEPVRLEDDYYSSINAEWLATAVIPPDANSINSFTEIQDAIDEQLMSDFEGMAASDEQPDEQIMADMIEYYRQAKDVDVRNSTGVAPLIPRLERILSYENLDQLENDFADYVLNAYPAPVYFDVGADGENSSVNALFADGIRLLLGARSYYEDQKELGEVIKEAKRSYAVEILKLCGYSEEEAVGHWEAAFAFEEAVLVPLSLTEVESADIAMIYNRMPFSDFANFSELLDFSAIVYDLCGTVPENIIVSNLKYIESIDTILAPETFDGLKSLLFIHEAISNGQVLSEEVRALEADLNRVITGQEEMVSVEKFAYQSLNGFFLSAIGKYYGQTYFGEEAKADVTALIEGFIVVYRERLQQNDWLTETTRDYAIGKLDAMAINVGWMDKLPGAYELYEVTATSDGGSFFENTYAILRVRTEYNFSELSKPVDRESWQGIGAHIVNAFYNPQENSVNFPAAILNDPFYSKDNTTSSNLGGIGVVIGHEITHAFDSQGSQFDKDGAIRNWWTDEDRTEFDKRTQAMVELFDGLPIGDIEVNGELTKTENVADAGGISSSLELMASTDDANYIEFFENYARIWRGLMHPEAINTVYLTDTHAPGVYRVNIQLGNAEKFYEIYAISESDEMYIDPARRTTVW